MAKRGRKPGASKAGADYKSLLAELTQSISSDIMRGLDVAVRKVSEAVRGLEHKVSGTGNGRRGRKPGRKPGRKATAAQASTPTPAKRGRKRKGNAPAGALKAATMEVLSKASKPMALKDIAAAVMKSEHFIGRNAKSVYNKMNSDLGKNAKVKKVGPGLYQLKK